jgi:hypothetical protein
MILDHIPEADRDACVQAMKQCLDAWQVYRDDVARVCGLERA